jgi:hypothetical protein
MGRTQDQGIHGRRKTIDVQPIRQKQQLGNEHLAWD